MESSSQNNGSSITYKSVKDYVLSHGGNKVIETILIANNGIAAVKCMNSIRKWAYATFGDERAIQFVVMATPEDLKANAEYIRMADQIEEVPGGSNANNYANVDLIVEIAERRGVQAVWAGWGHASENPKLPDSLSKTADKIAFIGPPSGAMRDLGDKIASTLIAQSANVNCVPWNGTGLTLNYASEGIPDDMYRKATVCTLEETVASVKRIGYPVMIKASEGGGGKGIRKVLSDETLESAFRQVQGEVPGSPIFIMKMVKQARHLEVQILADQYGQGIALYGRDCSVQRRHQKIIEEGPPIIAPKDKWEEMERAAVRMTKEVGYVGVGTVEYLYVPETNEYYFLELNPRLQVEHPVSELITGVNLLACQVNVAMGIPLNRIPDIRKFYMQEDIYGDSSIDFVNAKRAPPKGHAIAVRITGENPDEGFKPTSGGIQELTFRSNSNVWGYFSVGTVGGLHEYADSQFGHVFSHGNTRDESRRDLIVALKNLSIRGDISTIVAYVCFLLETEVFKNNAVTTGWLDGLIETAVHEEKPDKWLVVLCGALYKAYTLGEERNKQYISMLDRGQAPPRELLKIEDDVDLIYENMKYTFNVKKSGSNCLTVALKSNNSKYIEAEMRPLGDGGYLILLNGKSNVCYGTETVTGLKLMINGRTCIFSTEYDPTKLRVTTAGKLVRYLVENGSHMKQGTPYAEMEVMKMYLPLIATESGRISFTVPEGTILESGAIVASFQLDDPSKVRTATIFQGELPSMKLPRVKGEKVHQALREIIISIRSVLNGYYCNDTKELIQGLFSNLYNPELPIFEMKESISRIANKLPKVVFDDLNKELQDQSLISKNIPFSGERIKNILDQYCSSLQVNQKKDFNNLVTPLYELSDRFHTGVNKYAQELLTSFFKDYLESESVYQGSRDDVLTHLRQLYKSNLKRVYEIDLSHLYLNTKNRMMFQLMEEVNNRGLAPFSYLFHELSDLSGFDQHAISLKAKRMLIIHQLPSFEQLKISMEKDLLERKFDDLLSQGKSIFHIITSFFTHSSQSLRETALEVYLRRSYRAYNIKDMKITSEPKFLKAEWQYMFPDQEDLSMESVATSPSSQSHPEIGRIDSDNNLFLREKELLAMEQTLQHGIMFIFQKEADLFTDLPNILNEIIEKRRNKGESPMLSNKISITPSNSSDGQFKRVLNLSFPRNGDASDSLEISKLRTIIQSCSNLLRKIQIRRVTVMMTKPGDFPSYFTFRERMNFEEHPIYRHLEPPLAFHLELRRLSNYDIQRINTENQQIHLYFGEAKKNTPEEHQCFFARVLIRGGVPGNFISPAESVIVEAENVLNEACNAIEVARGEKEFKNTWNNHIFLKFILDINFDPDTVINIISSMSKKYEKRLGKLKVGTVEIVGRLKKSESNPNPSHLRFKVTNPTGFRFCVDAYLQMKDTKVLYLGNLADGPNSVPTTKTTTEDIFESYKLPLPIQKKRLFAISQNTIYVYDMIEVLDESIKRFWKQHISNIERNNAENQTTFPVPTLPAKFVEATELILDPSGSGELVPTNREPGLNDVGMVVWKIKLFTPEYVNGRDIIVISNDLTYQIGSFGVLEDVVFKKASEMSRKLGIPRIYLASNSGARIGLAQEVKEKFRVNWIDNNNPSKGFQYLYLNDEEYDTLSKMGSVNAKKVGDNLWQVIDIIGVGADLGVENLRGSGMIAGETSLAYEETFTLTLITGRTVGIGAYLVRLGQRTVQHKGPIILTGASALNKVLGKKVYSSNVQLGGTQIMFANGVSHLIANDEIEAITSIINWLSYIPHKIGGRLPILNTFDPVDRPIDFTVFKNQPYDPRQMLSGYQDTTTGKWISGFFDKGSFTETLAGWAKTVICGRARLGGIPMGVIAVETRTIEQVEPADPAVYDSNETVTPKAGQVWFPDSAYKTAQAIKDFNKGEQLPLLIFANWRGFSGGLRDLFDEILKYGSYIVDALREYSQPVFVYIPPFGELRGGAWVVVDSTINPDKMEMYCDETGRGGVLEPSGTIEIKFKEREIIKTMHRLDNTLISLDKQFKESKSDEIKAKIEAREKELTPLYEQVAITFADLHDTPGRMKAKGVTRETLIWRTSRTFFYHRVQRRMEEEYLFRKMSLSNPKITNDEKITLEKQWLKSFTKENDITKIWEDDKIVSDWLMKEENLSIQFNIDQLRSSHVKHEVINFMKQDINASLDGLLSILTPEQKAMLIEKLKK